MIRTVLVVAAIAVLASAARTDNGLLYMIGKTEEKHKLTFYGYEIPSGTQFHYHQYNYDGKHQGHAVHDHDDLGVAFNQKSQIFLVTDAVSVMELRANKNQIVSRNEVYHLHQPESSHTEGSCIVALEYDRVCQKAIVVSDVHEDKTSLEIHTLNPSSGNTRYLCSTKFGDVSSARHGIHTWDPVGDKLYYVVGTPHEQDLQLITYEVDRCQVLHEPRLQENHIVKPGNEDRDQYRMNDLLSFDYSELTNTLIGMMTTTNGKTILAKVFPTSGNIVELYDYTNLVEGFHYVQGVTYLDYEHHLHFSVFLEGKEIVTNTVDRMLGKHEEWDVKVRFVAVNVETGALAFTFDADVNHSFIPRGIGFVPDGKYQNTKRHDEL